MTDVVEILHFHLFAGLGGAARGIASVMGKALLLAWAGERFALGSTPVWVHPLVVAVSVETPT